MPESMIHSKSSPLFKDLQAMLQGHGIKRTHTLLIGEELLNEWFQHASKLSFQRVQPYHWIHLEGASLPSFSSSLKVPAIMVHENCMRELTDMHTPPSVILMMTLEPETTLNLSRRVAGAWGIQHPGNLGAMCRSAAAFSFQDFLIGPETADPFSPKSLRGSMGTVLHLHVRRLETLPFEVSSTPDNDGELWIALDGRPQSKSLAEVDWNRPVRLLVGNEGHGWEDVTLPNHVIRVRIPIEHVDSLNASVALSIACYASSIRKTS